MIVSSLVWLVCLCSVVHCCWTTCLKWPVQCMSSSSPRSSRTLHLVTKVKYRHRKWLRTARSVSFSGCGGMDLVCGMPGVLLHGRWCGRHQEAAHDPPQLLWHHHVYGLILSLAAPSKPTAVPYPELVKRITAHFNPDRPRLCHNSSSAPGHSSLVSPLPPMCLNCGSYLSSVSMVSPWMTCCVTVSCVAWLSDGFSNASLLKRIWLLIDQWRLPRAWNW